MLIYGINAVVEALRAGRVREIRIAGRSDDRLRAIIEDATDRGVRMRHVTRDALDTRNRPGSQPGQRRRKIEWRPIRQAQDQLPSGL